MSQVLYEQPPTVPGNPTCGPARALSVRGEAPSVSRLRAACTRWLPNWRCHRFELQESHPPNSRRAEVASRGRAGTRLASTHSRRGIERRTRRCPRYPWSQRQRSAWKLPRAPQASAGERVSRRRELDAGSSASLRAYRTRTGGCRSAGTPPAAQCSRRASAPVIPSTVVTSVPLGRGPRAQSSSMSFIRLPVYEHRAGRRTDVRCLVQPR